MSVNQQAPAVGEESWPLVGFKRAGEEAPFNLVDGAAENLLLSALPPRDYRALWPRLERVELARGQVLQEPGELVRHAYFPRQAMISLVSLMRDGLGGEVGVVGREGMLGISIILGADVTPILAAVQIAGPAWRISAEALQEACLRGEALRHVINRYIQALFVQVSQSAACNAHHHLEARLRRWLLMSYDCVQSDCLPLTHEFLSHMLGVRRSGITVAAQALQEQRLISYRRGRIMILDRLGLEETACECYRLVKNEFERLLGT